MASIRKRNGKYQARIHRRGVGFISKTFLTRGDALGWARQAEINVERLALGPRRPTLDELLERYAVEVTPAKKAPDRRHTSSRLGRDHDSAHGWPTQFRQPNTLNGGTSG